LVEVWGQKKKRGGEENTSSILFRPLRGRRGEKKEKGKNVGTPFSLAFTQRKGEGGKEKQFRT